MSIEAHIKFLNEKHDHLEEEIHDAYIHHLPTEELKELKKKKLQIKDQIANLNHSNDNRSAA